MTTAINNGISDLGRQQAGLMASIFDAPDCRGPLCRSEGVAVYRRNLLAAAEGALGVTYPTARRLLGQSAFQSLVAELLALYPPTLGDWGEWGEELPLLIDGSEAGRAFPFAAPVAALDWLRHRANRAVNNVFDAASASLLQSDGLDHVGIAIADHAGLISSVYPLVDIFAWHGDAAGDAGDLQVSDAPRPVLVCRPGFRAEQAYISEAEYAFVQGLRAGRSIGSLLDAPAARDFDFPGWITRAIGNNLINHFYRIKEN